MKRHLLVLLTAPALLVAGCALNTPMQQPPLDAALTQNATAGPLAFAEGSVLMNNDAAFAAKLRLIAEARESLDLAYYIFSDDHTSSLLSQALIEAADRGVRVRLLVDYFSSYKDLDRFSWLEQQGGGNIEVRFYNRPTLEIIKDAAFLTMSCADVGASASACDDEKLRVVNSYFEPDALNGQGFSNRSFAGSGLFLSGLYGKHPQMLAYAVTRGQGIDPEALAAGAPAADDKRTEQLKALGKLYFRARYMSGVESTVARLKLAYVRTVFADQVNPVFDTVNSYLPLARQNNAQAQKDWDYLTEFLHHKFLLADRSTLILGGRNVEDSYHMEPSALSDKYTFMDTDVRLKLEGDEATLASSFDRLWQLRSMVASIGEVRQHAPNDLLANFDAVQAAQDACKDGKDSACVDREVDKRFVPLAARMHAVDISHREYIARYANEYHVAEAPPPLRVDDSASIYYLENLPVTQGERNYGARHNREAASSKHIQALWRAALQNVCAAGSSPREVVFHNAYLFMPANLLQDVGAMLDGSRPCPGVSLSLITNSLATTDLNVVNLLAVWQLKALADHLQETGTSTSAASLHYLEYQPEGNRRRSLHSKVMLFDKDIFIGSANADVRSLMMDSNNGIMIRNAPDLVQAYRDRLQALLARPGFIADQTALIGRDKAELSVEMNALVDQLLARYAGDGRLSAQQQADLKQQVQDTTQKVYTLSREILRGNAKAADEFNARFKAI